LEEERGTIPMALTKAPHQPGKIFAIGTASGQVKASTGYAFTRMQRDAKQKVNQLPSLIKARHLFYDSILLNMIESENKAIPLVMDRLFGRINFAKILRFLDEKTSIWDEIRIFSQLQIPLFLKHLLTRNR
jgi:lycopene beta-cyclase